jgi:YVTN family beta-propeller protein
MKNTRLALALLGTASVLLYACGGGGSSQSSGGGPAMDVESVSNGFGDLLPHRVKRLDPLTGQAAVPEEILRITTLDTLMANVRSGNPVLPVARFLPSAILPSGDPGNHFLVVRFTHDLDIRSVLDASPGAQASNGLTGTITLVVTDPATGSSTPIPVRVFLNGQTYAGTPVIDPDTGASVVPLQTWVELVDGKPTPVAGVDNDLDTLPDGIGFPGTEGSFAGMADLISPRTLVFVADSDGDLSTHETFPSSGTIRLRISRGVRDTRGGALVRQALAASTVGPDVFQPEVATTPPPSQLPLISPGQGDADIDPLTSIQIDFTEPVQPLTVGSFPDGTTPLLSASVRVTFGPASATVVVPFTAEPVSALDLSSYTIQPTFSFPGSGPDVQQCGVFNRVDVSASPQQIMDLAGQTNILGAQTYFMTGEGAGLVNAPVTPDAIYVARGGAVPGISVIDLNGFGAGTGNPTFDPLHPTIPGNSNYPNNPNVALQGPLLIPALPSQGACTINGGSAGVYTLTRDSSLNDLVARAPIITSTSDMMIGHALDGTFNNGPSPFGCQSLGGNLCAFDGIKLINAVINIDGMIPVQPGQFSTIVAGAENMSCWGPHPNPPPLDFPPLCVSPYLGAKEPTSINTVLVNLQTNVLLPGNNTLGDPVLGIPPSTLLSPEQNSYFEGPSPPMPGSPLNACSAYMMRQQIGHFLYIVDRGRREILVLNSNRMTVIDRIPVSDPTTLAMSPNLDLLAVTSQTANQVSFIDINPASATFHQIVQQTSVGLRPRGIAWEPANEDIFVCNEGDNSVSILSAASLQVRRVIRNGLQRPFDVAITPRQQILGGFGFNRDTYFAWILNRTGTVAFFESGPNGVNGWGADDVIAVSASQFKNPKAIEPDYTNLFSGCWIAHEGPIDTLTGQAGPEGIGAISNLVIESSSFGRLPLNNLNLFTNPQLRDMQLGVKASFGEDVLSGVPVDLAFDNMRHISGLPNVFSQFSAGIPLQINGKGLVRPIPGGVRRTTTPTFLFVAVPNPFQGSGVVDVLRLTGSLFRDDTNAFLPGVQSIPVPDVSLLMDYFRE